MEWDLYTEDEEEYDDLLEDIDINGNEFKEKNNDNNIVEKPNIVVIDPGIYNCGISYYSLEKEKYIKVFRKAFLKRPKEGEQKKADNGNRKLIQSVKNFIKEEKEKEDGIFKNENTIVFVENQTLGKSFSNGPNYLKKGSFTNAKNLAVQNTFQITFEETKCHAINSASVKAHFRDKFPLEPGAKQSKQYRLDKKNAIVFGKTLIPYTLNAELHYKYKGKEDDCYDAIVMTEYVKQSFDFVYYKNEKQFHAIKINKKPKSKKKKITKKKPDENKTITKKNNKKRKTIDLTDDNENKNTLYN